MSYTSKDVKVKNGLDHIKINPGMYIGDTDNPVHLIEEALDNGLDECFGGYAKIVAINLDTKKFIYTVIDNGRGIPIEDDVPILICTKLFSGAKHQDEKKVYQICSGLHGIGITAVNALSDFFIIEIYRDSKHAIFNFENGFLKTKTIEDFDGEKPFSTKIQFRPNKKIFESLIPNIDRIRKRLLCASFELPDCTFVLNINNKKEVIKTDENKFFEDYCLNNNDTEKTDIVKISSKIKEEKFEVKFCFSSSGNISPKIASSINLLPVENGGTHVLYIQDLLKEYFIGKIKKTNYNFQIQDTLIGLRCHLSLSLIDPKFSSQSKEKLSNSKSYFDIFTNNIIKRLDEFFESNPNILKSILDHFQRYRDSVEHKKVKVSDKRASTKFTKLRDCANTKGELFIVEGDSAAGTLIQCRDPKKHAIFPLKGKIPSVVNKKEILDNKEVNELIMSLGTGVGTNFDLSKLRYDKIVCATDPDADGGHIFCLLAILLANIVPDVVLNGHFYYMQTPLYAVNKKSSKTFIPIWSEEELENVRKNETNITRFKGLGEFDPWQLRICAFDESTRRLIQIKFPEDLVKINDLLSDPKKKRDLLKEVIE